MEFKVLGPVEVRGAGGPARLGGPKQVALLTALIMRANHVVPTGELIEATWGHDPLDSAAKAMHSSVFRLRRALSDVERGERIVTHSTGYLIRIEPGELDLDVFRDHVVKAREAATLEEAAARFQLALDLWRGPALAGVIGESAQVQAAGLNETRTSVIVEQIDVRLAMGEHAALIPELNLLVAANPLLERLRGQLLLALYRSGRQADALAAYQEIRRLLADELGIEPGQPLRSLHERVLSGDPTLDLPAPKPAMAATGHVPRQLPADIVNFTGRGDYLDRLDALVSDGPGVSRAAVVISAIAGIGGVGKTALALHWAHRIADRHPDGQLYVNLRGYASTPPMMPTEALPIFLRALGVPQAAIPLGQDGQAAMYRSLLADRRALIVLDNAASVDQVRPLLPGTSSCLVLVTSRDDLLGLTALHDAHRLVLNVLSADEARTLLTRIVGVARVDAEPDATAELAQLCGYLPLALRIAAAQLAGDPRRPISDYVAQLTADDRLTKLAIEKDREAAVRASFDLSYQTLEPDAARLFRMLGLTPAPDCAAPAAAALIDESLEETNRLLDRLAAAHLIESTEPDRYVLHDLLRLYAGERARDEDSEQERDEALGRLFSMYLHTSDLAVAQMYPSGERMLPQLGDTDGRALPIAGLMRAKTWLDSERVNLVAVIRYVAEHGPRHLTWRLAEVLAPYFYGGMYRSDWLEISALGLRIASEDAERVAEAAMMHVMHRVHFAFGEYDKALDYGLRSLEQYPTAQYPGGEAEMCKQFGHTYWLLGRLADSLANFTRARDLYRRIGNRVSESICMNGMSLSFTDWGRLDDVLDHIEQALVIHREIGSRLGEAAALHIRGMAYAELGRFDEALDEDMRALALYHQTGFRYNEASVLTCIASVYRDTGRLREAVEFGQRALTVATEFNDSRGASLAHAVLASTLDDADEALAHAGEAVRIAKDTGYLRSYVDALIVLASICRVRGDHDAAVLHVTSALTVARECEFRLCVGVALTVLAEIQVDLGESPAAYATEALECHREVGHPVGEARALRTLGKVSEANAILTGLGAG